MIEPRIVGESDCIVCNVEASTSEVDLIDIGFCFYAIGSHGDALTVCRTHAARLRAMDHVVTLQATARPGPHG